jgi:hypothetical protein
MAFLQCLAHALSRVQEIEPVVCAVCVCTYIKIYIHYKELAHVIMEAGKSQDLQWAC